MKGKFPSENVEKDSKMISMGLKLTKEYKVPPCYCHFKVPIPVDYDKSMRVADLVFGANKSSSRPPIVSEIEILK